MLLLILLLLLLLVLMAVLLLLFLRPDGHGSMGIGMSGGGRQGGGHRKEQYRLQNKFDGQDRSSAFRSAGSSLSHPPPNY